MTAVSTVTTGSEYADHVARSTHLLDHGRFTTLATVGEDGPWASTVNFVALRDPLRLLYYSLHRSRHSRNIDARPDIAGSVHLLGTPGFGLDGAQFTGRCEAVPAAEVPWHRQVYYELNHPDPEVRAAWLLPEPEFTGDGPRRFYVVHVRRWWLLDIDRWLADKHDTRVEVDLARLATAARP
ncbi:Pyridoxamine 5'-phosphate oxidase [Streptomyces sp. TLI_053]|nr:Pyridoxamine 5'-phosphate oxidase [Streptomyces sp. TLI_053]